MLKGGFLLFGEGSDRSREKSLIADRIWEVVAVDEFRLEEPTPPEARSRPYTSSIRNLLPTAFAAFTIVFSVTDVFSGSSNLSRDARLVFIS